MALLGSSTLHAGSPSGFPQNSLDLADGNPIGLGYLGNRHAVFRAGSNTREL
jgi:hypothetical protein